MIAYFAWSAATTDRWNSFDWKMFLARIHSPKASFWDGSLRKSFGRYTAAAFHRTCLSGGNKWQLPSHPPILSPLLPPTAGEG
ncbi:MAG: hypothetical protein ACK6A7_22135, partial [Planctomycetota bacterium]